MLEAAEDECLGWPEFPGESEASDGFPFPFPQPRGDAGHGKAAWEGKVKSHINDKDQPALGPNQNSSSACF